VELDVSQNATVEMNTAPTGGSGAVLTSFWQNDETVLRSWST
jgi:hypothetical protein